MIMDDINMHLESMSAGSEAFHKEETKGEEESKGEDVTSEVQAIEKVPHALINDVIHFDLSCLDFMTKLGEGKSSQANYTDSFIC